MPSKTTLHGRARVDSVTPDAASAAGLLRMANMFCDAKALITAAELNLFGVLHGSPCSAEEIRARLGLHGRGLADLLNLLVGIGVLDKADGRYANTDAVDRYLVPGPDYLGGFLIGAGVGLYPAYGKLADALRTGKPQTAGTFDSMLDDEKATGNFVRMMDGLSQGLVDQLVDGVDWSGVDGVLDLGGCRGNVVGHLVRAHRSLTGTVLDLPPLQPFFDEHMAALGVSGATRFIPGDIFSTRLPAADVMIYGHVLSDWSPDDRATLLRRAGDALAPGGRLLVYDRMLGVGRNEVENLVASLNMLLMTEGEYTVAELAEQAAGANLDLVGHQPLGDYDTLASFVRS
jgi:SAM-dependent methyltransferase